MWSLNMLEIAVRALPTDHIIIKKKDGGVFDNVVLDTQSND